MKPEVLLVRRVTEARLDQDYGTTNPYSGHWSSGRDRQVPPGVKSQNLLVNIFCLVTLSKDQTGVCFKREVFHANLEAFFIEYAFSN